MPYLNLRPSQVILDPDNPRLPDGTSSDREAINRLLDDGADALGSLARDIAKTGQTNPAEIPIAIKDGNRYLIVEGNRRFAVLKLLKDPTLADDEEHQKMFRRAVALGTPPSTIHTLVVASREEADRWIVLRHTGENNGVGVKRWSASQTATHRRRANKPIDSGTLRSIVIADDLEEAYAADAEIVRLVRQLRRVKLTNIGRFFSPDILTDLHFIIRTDEGNNLDTKTLFVCHSAEQLRNFFAWALAYILDNPVDAYKSALVRRNALQTAAHLLPDPEDAAVEPFRLVDRVSVPANSSSFVSTTNDTNTTDDEATDDSGVRDQSEDGSANSNRETPVTEENQTRGTAKKPEAKPERYLLQGLKLPGHPDRIQRLLKECRSLELEAYPGIACVMMRVIVELSVSSVQALQLSGASENSPLKVKIVSMLKFLDPQIENPRGRNPELTQAYLEASELGVQYLHGFVHNPSVVPDQHLARRFSAAFRPLLSRVDEEL
jgi:hypothetical protein